MGRKDGGRPPANPPGGVERETCEPPVTFGENMGLDASTGKPTDQDSVAQAHGDRFDRRIVPELLEEDCHHDLVYSSDITCKEAHEPDLRAPLPLLTTREVRA